MGGCGSNAYSSGTVSEHLGIGGKFYKEGGGHTEVLMLNLAWSLALLTDLRAREGGAGAVCRGPGQSDHGGEVRHLPGHLREAQFAIPVQVKHP